MSQPTWGVDVGAAAQIRGEILALRDAGCAVLVVSEELEELFEISDRLHVIAKGRLSPSIDRAARDGVADRRMDERVVGGAAAARAAALTPALSQGEREEGQPCLSSNPVPQASRFWSLASPVLALADHRA